LLLEVSGRMRVKDADRYDDLMFAERPRERATDG